MRFSNLSASLFILPAALLFGLFVLYPTASGLAMSFTNAQGVAGGNFVGADNYLRLAHDLNFKDALRNTLLFALVIVVVQNLLGLAVASWMRNQPAVRNVARAGLLLGKALSFCIGLLISTVECFTRWPRLTYRIPGPPVWLAGR